MNVARCRSCNAEILWAISSSSGGRIPLDRRPIIDPGPADFLLVKGEDAPIAITRASVRYGNETVKLLDRDVTNYRTHFVTCPDAAEHRKAS